MYSIIVFSDQSISVSTNKPYKIVQQRACDGEEEDIFTAVEWMFDELNAFVEVDDEIKRKLLSNRKKIRKLVIILLR